MFIVELGEVGHWIVLWPGYSREMLSTIWLQTVSGSTVEVVQPLTGLTGLGRG